MTVETLQAWADRIGVTHEQAHQWAMRGIISTVKFGKRRVVVTTDEQIPPPTAPTGLRLLCLRVETVSGQTRLLPVHTMHPMPPRNRHHGKWGSDRYACFVLRDTQARPATAEVLVRCARHRQTHSLRPALGPVRVGGLS